MFITLKTHFEAYRDDIRGRKIHIFHELRKAINKAFNSMTILIIEAKNAWSKILEHTLHLQVKIVILIQNTLFCTQ